MIKGDHMQIPLKLAANLWKAYQTRTKKSYSFKYGTRISVMYVNDTDLFGSRL